MNRRNILQTGLTFAGSALLASQTNAQPLTPGQMKDEGLAQTSPPANTRRKLGTLDVSSVGLGVQNMHRTYQTTVPYRPDMIKIIRKAFDSGVTLFDTAEAYGPFECERILGESIAPFRNKIVIETKYGWNIDQKTGQRLPGLNSRPEHIKEVVEGMLKRLRTDRIDVLYQHRVDPAVPIDDVVGAIKDLINEGKIVHYGLSEPGPQTIRRAHAIHPVTAIQNEYSLLWRGPEETILPLCQELGIGFVCWSPLGVGFLTGAIDANTRFAPGDIRGIEERFSPENLPHNLALVDMIKRWAARKQATPAQISLAWLLAQKPWIVPIPGTTQMAHMLDNAGAMDVKFTAGELQHFNQELAGISIQGLRLPPAVLNFSNVEAPLKPYPFILNSITMKKALLTAITGLMYTISIAQHRLEKVWESDSITLKGPESVLYDAKSNALYVSSMNSGRVVRMGLDGKITKSDWVTGLNANKGSALFNGLFYTAEIAAVAVIDVANASIVKRIPIEGAVMLNDLVVDSTGVVYVSDTRTGKVYRIEGDKPTLYLENIPGANGLLTVNTDLYVVGSTTFQKVNAAKEIIKIADGFESGLDGIVMVAENEFVLSNYKGILYYVKADGSSQVLVDTRTQRIMANDISYNSQTKTVYVPSFGTNRIIAYTLK